MQKAFVLMAVAAAGAKELAELSNATGMDTKVLKTWIDAMVLDGDLKEVFTDDGVGYEIRENDI